MARLGCAPKAREGGWEMEFLRNKKLWAVGLVLILGMMMACAVIARAQATASISGRTLDNGGASIPDGKVTVKSVETGETRTATTGQDGSYRVLSLPVGKYEVKV